MKTAKSTSTKTSKSKRTTPKRAAKTTKSKLNKSDVVASKYREQMIAEAAYFKALNRNFQGDYCVEDWLEAEKDIDTSLIHQ